MRSREPDQVAAVVERVVWQVDESQGDVANQSAGCSVIAGRARAAAADKPCRSRTTAVRIRTVSSADSEDCENNGWFGEARTVLDRASAGKRTSLLPNP